MSEEICPSCHGIAMTKMSKVVSFSSLTMKCKSCGQNLRLSQKQVTKALAAAFLLGLALVLLFGLKGWVAFAISAALIVLPASYFAELEIRK
jgi:hypothetical protein